MVAPIRKKHPWQEEGLQEPNMLTLKQLAEGLRTTPKQSQALCTASSMQPWPQLTRQDSPFSAVHAILNQSPPSFALPLNQTSGGKERPLSVLHPSTSSSQPPLPTVEDCSVTIPAYEWRPPPTVEDYLLAFPRGAIAGAALSIEVLLHPYENAIKPTALFLHDAAVTSVHEEALAGVCDPMAVDYPAYHAAVRRDPDLRIQAVRRNRERAREWEASKKLFVEGSWPQRIEMGTTLLVTALMPGSVAKLARTVVHKTRNLTHVARSIPIVRKEPFSFIPHALTHAAGPLPWITTLPSMEDTLYKLRTLCSRDASILLSLSNVLCGGGLALWAGYGRINTLLMVKHAALAGAAMGVTPPTIDLTFSVASEAALHRQAAASRGDQTVVYVLPKRDWNGASHRHHTHRCAKELAEGKKLVVSRLDSPDKLTELIAAQKKGSISHLYLSFHGTTHSIQFGDTPTTRQTDASFAEKWPLDRFAQRAEVILDCCSAGELLHSGIADQLQRRLGDVASVIAPKEIVYSNSSRLIDGQVHFIVPGERDVTRNVGQESKVPRPAHPLHDSFDHHPSIH